MALIIVGIVLVYSAFRTNARAGYYLQNPETAEQPVHAMPLLISPNFELYTDLQSESALQDFSIDAPLAYLPSISSDLGSIESTSVFFPEPRDWWNSDEVIGFAVLSNVRYVGSGHVVVVSVSKPTPAALRENFVAGDETVNLAGDVQGWLTSGRPDGLTNAVVFLKDDLIITVASDLSSKEIVSLAGKVVVTK